MFLEHLGSLNYVSHLMNITKTQNSQPIVKYGTCFQASQLTLHIIVVEIMVPCYVEGTRNIWQIQIMHIKIRNVEVVSIPAHDLEKFLSSSRMKCPLLSRNHFLAWKHTWPLIEIFNVVSATSQPAVVKNDQKLIKKMTRFVLMCAQLLSR